MKDMKTCPFCKEKKVFIGVHDDEGNYHGPIGCEYEKDPWSGLCYALHHEGWGDCILCTDGADSAMGGVLFDTADEAAAELNKGAESEKEESPRCKYWRASDRYARWGSSGVCLGTKEDDPCKCNGDPSKCDFYPKKEGREQ